MELMDQYEGPTQRTNIIPFRFCDSIVFFMKSSMIYDILAKNRGFVLVDPLGSVGLSFVPDFSTLN